MSVGSWKVGRFRSSRAARDSVGFAPAMSAVVIRSGFEKDCGREGEGRGQRYHPPYASFPPQEPTFFALGMTHASPAVIDMVLKRSPASAMSAGGSKMRWAMPQRTQRGQGDAQ